MTQVGHILTGAAIGVAFLPEQKSTKWKTVYFTVMALLANVPDLQLPFWGHHRFYYVSHSIFVNIAIILLLFPVFIFWKDLRRKIGGWKVFLAGGIAWLSHLLLDTFYNQPKGLMMFWPFSEARLRLPIPWFSVVTSMPPPITADHVRIILVELAFYGSILIAVIILRKFISNIRRGSS